MSTLAAADAPKENPAPDRRVAVTVTALAVVAFLFSFVAVGIGFHQNLYSFHSFRQTQTALAAESMAHGGPFFRYEVPVLGPPWAVPFEFPLYQWLVACVVRAFHTRLEETGRAVSIAFYYLCFLPLASILKQLRFSRLQVLAVLAIFALSPLYIFVSRLFMIESTALFFCLMYVEQVLRLVRDDASWRYSAMAGAAIFGSLGGAIKVTTFAPYFVLGAGLLAWHIATLWRNGKVRPWRVVAAAVFAVAIPFALTSLWTKFADSIKSQNPLTAYLTSAQLRSWNFGTLRERLQAMNYVELLRFANDQVGYLVAAAVIGITYFVLLRRGNRVAEICIVLYAGTALLFFNLYIHHEYYPYAAAILLVVALGAMIAPFLAMPGWKAWVGVALLALEMASCVARYHRYYYRYQTNSEPGFPALAAIVDQTTRPDDIIVITGMNWAPVLPYQSQRRAIMDFTPEGLDHAIDLAPLQESIDREVDREGRTAIAAVVACGTQAGDSRLASVLRIAGIRGAHEFQGDGCAVYADPDAR
jgi:4-amino-4-deoxy-L-arabinose transferase-like glycosyltransferase